MKKRIFIISMLLCLVAGVKAQVTIKEVAGIEKTDVLAALRYIADPANSVSPDANGVIHIVVAGNVTEPSLEEEYEVVTTGIRAARINITNGDIKRIVVSSNNDTKHTITVPSVRAQDYIIKMANLEAELEVSNLTFKSDAAKDASYAWIASTSLTTGTSNTRTYFHDCIFSQRSFMQTNAIKGKDMSDTFEFINNEWGELNGYIFHAEGGTGEDMTTNIIFTNNKIYAFRGASLKSVYSADNENALKRKFNVDFEGNTFYHLINYADKYSTSSAVCLLQNTAPLNGEYIFKNNIILGHFTEKGTIQGAKTCAMLLQHNGGNYQGIVDGSSFIFENNTVQCDVYQIGWKGGIGDKYETDDVTGLVADGSYYTEGQHGEYDASIASARLIHMYPKESATHSDDDACHVCNACGEMVVQADVAGHGGTFQYEGSDGKMHDVNSAVATIEYNLYPEVIAEGVNLYDEIKDNITRKGFRLEPLATQDFVITPNVQGTLNSLKIYGRETPKDTIAESTDGGWTYNFTYTNDFFQKNRYIKCPKIEATFSYGSLVIECTGLEDGESALFDVKNTETNAIIVVNLTSENSKQIVGVSAGTYTVTPHDISGGKNWVWTYTMTPDAAQTKEVTSGDEIKLSFTVEKKEISTKNDENYKDNALTSAPVSNSNIAGWNVSKKYDL